LPAAIITTASFALPSMRRSSTKYFPSHCSFSALMNEFEEELDHSKIKSIFFINRKSLFGCVEKGMNSFSM